MEYACVRLLTSQNTYFSVSFTTNNLCTIKWNTVFLFNLFSMKCITPQILFLMKKPDIILVDDHQIFRQGIKSILTLENIATVIGEASTGKEFMELLTHLKPDLVLMDIDMPDMNGLEATEKAMEMMPDLKIIAFTMFGDEEYFLRMIELGAMGYILKSSDISELEKAIDVVMKGNKFFSNHQFKKTTINPENDKLKMLTESKKQKNKEHEELFPPWF